MRLERTMVWLCAAALPSPALAQMTTRVSVDSGGAQGNLEHYGPAISVGGRFVAFAGLATNLATGDTNGFWDVFVHDRQTGTTELVSVDSAGAQGDSDSGFSNGYRAISISDDGRYVAFASYASNLVVADTNGWWDVFVHDRQLSTTGRVSIASNGTQGNNDSGSVRVSISGDGRFVAFESFASNLVNGDTNGEWDVFVHDRLTATTERVSIDSAGVQGNSSSWRPSISPNGRYVAFESLANNLVASDTNGQMDVFVHDRQTGTSTRVSLSSSGVQGNSYSYDPMISAEGRFVAFESDSTNFVPGDTNSCRDVFVNDSQTNLTERVSVDSTGREGDSYSGHASMSSDGRFVAFNSSASNLVPGDTNGVGDVFVHDRLGDLTSRVSVSWGDVQGNGPGLFPSISADGSSVAFHSQSTNLVPDDTNGVMDIFVRDRGASFGITTFCFGDGTGTPCPCDNAGQPGHGCENSISTGGALLSGSGEALLSVDTLLLTSSGERPTAFSLFWQAGSEIAPRVFGDGIGCMGAPLKRMYRHNAVGGTVIAPQGADASVSVRSAALGDPISPGSTRGYYVFYRDPAPTFCPPPFGSTFNTTNGLRVLWGG